MSQQDLTPPQQLGQRTMALGIRTAIAAAGTSVHAVARRIGISSSYLTSLARGKKNPSQEMLHLLAETLGTSVCEIYRRGEVETERLRERDHRAARERAGRESTLAAMVEAMVHLEPEQPGEGELSAELVEPTCRLPAVAAPFDRGITPPERIKYGLIGADRVTVLAAKPPGLRASASVLAPGGALCYTLPTERISGGQWRPAVSRARRLRAAAHEPIRLRRA